MFSVSNKVYLTGVAIFFTVFKGAGPLLVGGGLLFVTQQPLSTQIVFSALPALVLTLLAAIGCIGIYQAKKWGAYSFVVPMTLLYLLNLADQALLYLDGNNVETLKIVVPIAIIIWFIHDFFFSQRKVYFQ